VYMCVFVCLCILMHDLSFLYFRTPSLLLCVCVSECVCVCLLYALSLFLVFARSLVSSLTFFLSPFLSCGFHVLSLRPALWRNFPRTLMPDF